MVMCWREDGISVFLLLPQLSSLLHHCCIFSTIKALTYPTNVIMNKWILTIHSVKVVGIVLPVTFVFAGMNPDKNSMKSVM